MSLKNPNLGDRQPVGGENRIGPPCRGAGASMGGVFSVLHGCPPLSLLSHLAWMGSPAYMPLGLRQPRSCRSVRTSVRSNRGSTFQTRHFHSRVGCHPHRIMGMSSSCHFSGRPRFVPTWLRGSWCPSDTPERNPALSAPVFAGSASTSFPPATDPDNQH